MAILYDSDHDLSSSSSRFDVTVRLGNLLQRISSIDGRSDLPHLDELSDKNQVFGPWARCLEFDLPASSPITPQPLKPQSQARVGYEFASFGFQQSHDWQGPRRTVRGNRGGWTRWVALVAVTSALFAILAFLIFVIFPLLIGWKVYVLSKGTRESIEGTPS